MILRVKRFLNCHCGNSFQSKKVLNYHEKVTHKDEYLYKCDECQKSFQHKHSLKTHKLTNEEAIGVYCRFCRKSFKSFIKENFERHFKKCHGKKFQKEGGWDRLPWGAAYGLIFCRLWIDVLLPIQPVD